jgi:hypothetical protein
MVRATGTDGINLVNNGGNAAGDETGNSDGYYQLKESQTLLVFM